MMKLEDVPADVQVVWFGKKWDNGCVEEIRIYAPEGEFCHECIDPLGTRSSGVAERDPDGRWRYYDPACWGEVLAGRIVKEALEADEQHEGQPYSDDR